MAREQAGRPAAQVDHLVDENASVVDVEDGSLLVQSDDIERSVGATAPTSWWRMGLIAIGIVAALLLLLQLIGNPGPPVQQDTSVSAPASEY